MVKTTIRKGAVLATTIIGIVAAGWGCGRGDQADSTSVTTASSNARELTNGISEHESQRFSAAKSVGNATLPSVDGTVSAGMPQTAFARKPPEIQVRQVIRKAELDIRVKNVEKAEKAVGAIVQSAGGYTENASSTDLASDHPKMNISLRVPVAAFESTIDKFESLGIRLAKKIGSEDVTGHIVDLDAQLKTLTIQAEVYRNMLRGRTQLEEVFNIQNQLTQVQTQIEEISSQRKSQAGLAALSTISLTLEQDAIISQPPSDPNWFNQSWAQATSSATTVMRFTAVALMWLVAFSPFWITAGLVLRRVARGTSKPKATSDGLIG